MLDTWMITLVEFCGVEHQVLSGLLNAEEDKKEVGRNKGV